MNDNDVALLERGVEILARDFFAAGARLILPGVHGFDELAGEADLARFSRARVRARDFAVSAYHPLGTARMSADPGAGVVDTDRQHHELPGLYVMDGAAVPSSVAVNPQVTIMALATRALCAKSAPGAVAASKPSSAAPMAKGAARRRRRSSATWASLAGGDKQRGASDNGNPRVPYGTLYNWSSPDLERFPR